MDNFIAGFVIDLQLFDAGGAGAGAGAAGAGSAGSDGGASTQGDAGARIGRKPNPEQDMQHGHAAQNAQDEAQHDAGADNGEPSREEWEALKKGRYARFYGEDVSSTIRDRLKNRSSSDETLGKLKPMLDAMMKKYGTA